MALGVSRSCCRCRPVSPGCAGMLPATFSQKFVLWFARLVLCGVVPPHLGTSMPAALKVTSRDWSLSDPSNSVGWSLSSGVRLVHISVPAGFFPRTGPTVPGIFVELKGAPGQAKAKPECQNLNLVWDPDALCNRGGGITTPRPTSLQTCKITWAAKDRFCHFGE